MMIAANIISLTVLFAVPVLIALLCGRREGGDEDA